MSIRDIVASLGTSVASNARDVPDEGDEHMVAEQVYEDALLRAIEDAVEYGERDYPTEPLDDLRWERDLLMADARQAESLFGPDCESCRTLIAMAREVNRDLVLALRTVAAL